MKRKKAIGEKGDGANPFIDPQGYCKAIDKAEAKYKDQLARERAK